jgi:hypothetical protein
MNGATSALGTSRPFATVSPVRDEMFIATDGPRFLSSFRGGMCGSEFENVERFAPKGAGYSKIEIVGYKHLAPNGAIDVSRYNKHCLLTRLQRQNQFGCYVRINSISLQHRLTKPRRHDRIRSLNLNAYSVAPRAGRPCHVAEETPR